MNWEAVARDVLANKKTLGEFPRFCQKYFKTELNALQVDLDARLQFNRSSLTEAPTGFGKSTILRMKCVQGIVEDPNIVIGYGMKDVDLSADRVKWCRDQLMFNDALISDYGPFFDKSQYTQQLKKKFTVRRSTTSDQPTMRALSIKSNMEGVRLKLFVGDDLIDLTSYLSQAARKYSKTWFDTTLIPRLDPPKTFWMVGTRWHSEDLYVHVKDKVDDFKRYKSIETVDGVETAPWWEDMYPLESLRLLRDGDPSTGKKGMGTIAFELKFQNNPLDLVGGQLDPLWIKTEEDKPDPESIEGGMDLNISDRKDSSWTVVCTAYILPPNVIPGCRILIVDFESAHTIDPSSLGERAWRREGHRKLKVENVLFQSLAVREMARRGMPVIGSGVKGLSKKARTLDVAPFVQNGTIRFWKHCRNLDKFVFEWRSFDDKSAPKDHLDAFWHCVQDLVVGGSLVFRRVKRDRGG